MPMENSDLEDDMVVSAKAEQILAGAMRTFLALGYAGTSMDRVAAAAGVSKHTIYNHFQDKEGLFNALIERLVLRRFYIEFDIECKGDDSGCELPQDGPPEQILRRLAKTFLNLRHDPEFIDFFRLLIAESGRLPELARLYNQKVIQEGNRVLAQFFQNQFQHPSSTLSPDQGGAALAAANAVAREEALNRSHIFFGSLVSYILAQEVLHGKDLAALSEDRLIDTLVALVLAPQVVD